MTTKLRIDLNKGVLEVEGSESFVKIIYNDFKTHFVGIEAADELKPARKTKPRAKTTPKATTPKATTAKPKPVAVPEPPPETLPVEESVPIKEVSSAYTVVSDLDLGSRDGQPSLVEFMDAKFPITNEERNIVFLYYLQYTLKLKAITADHIYTCYRQAKIRAPLNLEKSLQLTTDQHGWMKATKTGRISLTAAGKTYVEKQLPKKVKH